jgi:hypothetical protein
MSKKQRSKPAVAVLADPIANYVREVKQERADALIAAIPIPGEIHSEPSGNCIPSTIGLTYDPWADEVSRVVVTDESGKVVEDYKPIPREDYTLREILHPEISPLTREEESIAESLPRFRPRDCVQCTAKRPTRSSYSRVYCTKGNTRYIRCGWKPCGYRYKQVEE